MGLANFAPCQKSVIMKVLILQFFIFSSVAISVGVAEQRLNPAKRSSPFDDRYWLVESIIIHPALDLNRDGKPETDLLKLLPTCERDNVDLYRKDGLIITEWGTLNCDEDEENGIETGIWSFDPDTQTLTVEKYDSHEPIIAKVSTTTDNRIELLSTYISEKGFHTIKTILKSQIVN